LTVRSNGVDPFAALQRQPAASFHEVLSMWNGKFLFQNREKTVAYVLIIASFYRAEMLTEPLDHNVPSALRTPPLRARLLLRLLNKMLVRAMARLYFSSSRLKQEKFRLPLLY
jgi:hypothetical protein